MENQNQDMYGALEKNKKQVKQVKQMVSSAEEWGEQKAKKWFSITMGRGGGQVKSDFLWQGQFWSQT